MGYSVGFIPLSPREDRSRVSGRSTQAGFTLVEVVVALLILSGSMTILLGLQSSSLARTVGDADRQRAILIARQLLAVVDSADQPPAIGEFEGTIDEAWAFLATDPRDTNIITGLEEQRFRATISITNWGIPELNTPDVMRQINMTIWWDDGRPAARFDTVYFLPNFG